MLYESPRKIFRDMSKNPDEYLDPEEKALIKEELEKDEALKSKNKLDGQEEKKEDKLITPQGENFKKTVNNIFSAGLLEGKDDKDELKIIEQRRDVTLNYLDRVLEDVKNYLSQIGAGQLQKMSNYDDIKKYQADVKLSDETRKAYHDRLIGDIKIASRLININFNADFPNELRIKEESKMPDRKNLSSDDLKNKMAERKYFKFNFPAGSFIDLSRMPKDPQGEREYIAHWAFMLYSDLSLLRKEVSHIVDEIEKEKK